MENSNADDETYWWREEFRKGTPLFPRDLYNNLPALLNDCISLEDSFKPLSPEIYRTDADFERSLPYVH